MEYWFAFYLFVSVCAIPSDEISDDYDQCGKINCVGDEYECVGGQCYCARGYILNHFKMRCVKCPGLGDKCFGQCCNGNNSFVTLHCWHGVCQPCYDSYGNWVCRDNMKDMLLVSSAQIAMGVALVLGIIGALVLLYKLCATSDIRPTSISIPGTEGRLSIGSLQLQVEERLRDAPPRYTRTPASGSSIYPAISFLNNGFVHDSSIPPPPYSPRIKHDDNNNRTLHI